MSIKSYLEAVEWVLQREREMRRGIIIFRPGARRSYEEAERDIVLPHMGAAVFSAALGAVMTGMHVVLDLRDENDCAALLNEAFSALPENACPAITMLIEVEEAEKVELMENVQRLYPRDACQAAGLLRMALRAEYMSMLIMDEAYSEMKADVPDEDDFVLMPEGKQLDEDEEDDELWDDWEEVGDVVLDDASCEETEDGQTALNEAPQDEETGSGRLPKYEETAKEIRDTQDTAEEEQESMSEVRNTQNQQVMRISTDMCATRMMKYDPCRLEELSRELNAPLQMLVEKCVMRIYERFKVFECCYENDAVSGECAFLPPEQEGALLWIGYDMLSICYYAARMDHDQAARLLREMKRLLDKPVLLIYDREEEEA